MSEPTSVGDHLSEVNPRFRARIALILAVRTMAFLNDSLLHAVPVPSSATEHQTVFYFNRMLAIDTIIYHVCVGLSPPDTSWKRTSVDMES